MIISQNSRCVISRLYYLILFQGIFLTAAGVRADVTEYECSQGLSMPAVVQWTRILVDSGQASHTQGVSISSDAGGTDGFLITGSAWTDEGDDEYGLVVRMTQGGGIASSASFFDASHENGIYSISPVYNASHVLEGYIAAGFKTQTHKAPGEDNWWTMPDAWLLKLGLSLNMVWESSFGMQGEDWANAAFQNDAGYVFGGALRDISLYQGAWLFQSDAVGIGVWSMSTYYYCSRVDEMDDVVHDECPEPNIPTRYGISGSVIHSLLPLPDGGYLSGHNSRMQKLDSEGNRLWTALVPASAIMETGSGFAGVGIVTAGEESPAIQLTRVSASGETLWSATYGQNASGPSEIPDTDHRGGIGLVEAANGGYIVAGRVDMYDTGSTDLWLIKTRPDTEGHVDWALPIPGMRLNSARPIVLASDNNIIMAGSIVCDGQPRMAVIKVGISGLHAPQAAFTTEPEAPYYVDQEITFDGRTSSDPDGSITSYEWRFGDGTSGTGPVVHHRYSRTGDYTVTLKVTDNDGIPVFARSTITAGLPDVLWERIYPNQWTRANDIVEAVDGGFVICGQSIFNYPVDHSGHGQHYNCWLLKTFDNGIAHWEKNLTNDENAVETGSALDITQNNGYVVSGTFMPYDEEGDSISTMLIRTGSQGNPVWHRIYSNYAGADPDIPKRDVLSLDNGEFVVAGHRWQDGGSSNAMWLLRTDADGREIPGASHLYPSQDENCDSVVSLAVAPGLADGFVLTGSYCNQGFNAPLPLLKTSESGAMSWIFDYPAASWNKKQGRWVAAVDGGYVIAGQSNSNYGRAALMKVRSDGSESLWISHVPFESHGTSGAVDGSLTPDGGIVIVGWINEPRMYSPTKMFMAKFTGDGAYQWHKVFESNADYAWGTGVAALDDGSYLVLGDECRYHRHYGCQPRLIKIGRRGGPVAAFDSDLREGGLPLEIQFSDLTSGGTAPYTYAWDFDNDGTVDSSEQNPVFTYHNRGSWSVRLEVTDDAGVSDTFICEDCIFTYFPGIYTDAAGVEITDFSVTDNAAAEPETYDFQMAPEGLDQEGAFGFDIEATGPDGSYPFKITFPSPYDPDMLLYKLPDWQEIPYSVVDAYTIEVVLEITDGVLDPAFVLAATLPLQSLTIIVEGNGSTDPAAGTHNYFVDNSLSVAVSAIPDFCWEFDHWSGAASGSDNPVNIALYEFSSNTTLTAHFVAYSAMAGDLDCDRDVDGADLATLAGDISLVDMTAFAENFGKTEF